MDFRLFRANLKLNLFGMFRVPLLFYTRPRVVELNDNRCVIRIFLKRKTKNHWGSMYFGAQAIGADCCIGFSALEHLDREKLKASLLFKSFQINFLKRPDSHVFFICDDPNIKALVARVRNSSERQNEVIRGRAVTRKNGAEEIVSEFSLEVSLKRSN